MLKLNFYLFQSLILYTILVPFLGLTLSNSRSGQIYLLQLEYFTFPLNLKGNLQAFPLLEIHCLPLSDTFVVSLRKYPISSTIQNTTNPLNQIAKCVFIFGFYLDEPLTVSQRRLKMTILIIRIIFSDASKQCYQRYSLSEIAQLSIQTLI